MSNEKQAYNWYTADNYQAGFRDGDAAGRSDVEFNRPNDNPEPTKFGKDTPYGKGYLVGYYNARAFWGDKKVGSNPRNRGGFDR